MDSARCLPERKVPKYPAIAEFLDDKSLGRQGIAVYPTGLFTREELGIIVMLRVPGLLTDINETKGVEDLKSGTKAEKSKGPGDSNSNKIDSLFSYEAIAEWLTLRRTNHTISKICSDLQMQNHVKGDDDTRSKSDNEHDVQSKTPKIPAEKVCGYDNDNPKGFDDSTGETAAVKNDKEDDAKKNNSFTSAATEDDIITEEQDQSKGLETPANVCSSSLPETRDIAPNTVQEPPTQLEIITVQEVATIYPKLLKLACDYAEEVYEDYQSLQPSTAERQEKHDLWYVQHDEQATTKVKEVHRLLRETRERKGVGFPEGK
ncbi:MAG: hypothetical protein Q9218_004267 [Villophora microphyllina]